MVYLAVILIWWFDLVKITKLTVRYYRAIYAASMGLFPYSTEIHQLKFCQ